VTTGHDDVAAQPRPEIHHDHRDVTGGWLRPAVFGAMDGLISNFSLISGFAGAQASRHLVILSGLGGLVAGAFSMAVGEYVSVASQGDLARAEIEVERYELRHNAAAEQTELAELYISRGVDSALAHEVSKQLSRDPDQALEIHSREELGVSAGDLPSPYLASAAVRFRCLSAMACRDCRWPGAAGGRDPRRSHHRASMVVRGFAPVGARGGCGWCHVRRRRRDRHPHQLSRPGGPKSVMR
jgi:hypothetical protein